MSDKLNSISNELLNKNLKACSNEECYEVIKEYVARLEALREREDKYLQSKLGKKLYYISAEFLIGKLMSNNLINLGVYDEVRAELEAAGKELAQIEEIESEASLGNGGLGRLAACFLDSIANLGLNGDGVGLNYHLGLFRQVFENGRQKEVPDYWIGKDSWLIPTDVSYKIDFADFSVTSRMYDINVYGEKTTNKLHLFDIDIKGGQTFKESDTLTAGDSDTVFDTEFGKIGVMLCFDIRFPEMSRLMANDGAKVIFVPAAFNMTTGPAHWEISFRTRALDNQVYMVGCAPMRDASTGYTSWGHSIVTNPWGDVEGMLDEKEGILLKEIDLDYETQVREELPLLKSRRLDLYRVEKIL